MVPVPVGLTPVPAPPKTPVGDAVLGRGLFVVVGVIDDGGGLVTGDVIPGTVVAPGGVGVVVTGVTPPPLPLK